MGEGPGGGDPWERHAQWWQAGFTGGADPEYTEQILPLIQAHLAGAIRVLDVGTGEGQVARLAAAGGCRVVGLDPTWAQVREAVRRGPDGRAHGRRAGDADPADPGDASPGDASPGDAGVGDASPGDASPGDASPGDAGVGDASPGDASPGDASPGDAGPGDAGVGDASPGDASPGDAGPAYLQGGAGALPLSGSSFDAVVACLVFEHIRDVEAAIGEISRVLRPGGRFLFLLNHPLLQTPGSGWIDDHILEEQYWRIGPYLVEDETMEEVEKGVFIPFIHRPLSSYVNMMAGRGLLVVHMEEPAPPAGFLARAHEYLEAATIPRLLLMRAEKCTGGVPGGGSGATRSEL